MHDFANVVTIVVLCSFLVVVILGPQWLRARDRERMHETLRIAYEKGQPVPPELITALQTTPAAPRMNTPERDLRRAVVLIAVGLGLVGLGYGLWYGLMSVDETAAYTSGGSVAGLGAIPGLIGLAYLVLYLTRGRTPKA